MGLFRKTPEERLLREAVKLASQQMRPSAQGGGGGVETRWRGASRVLRSMASWLPGLGSPRKDLASPERKVLVARSRDAMRNHLIARAAIVRNRTSVVGTGLICRPQVDWEALGISEEEGEQLNAQLEREWLLWAEDPRECDAEATLNHYQLQALALVSALIGGDAFATTPDIERTGTVYSTRLQLIETDRVSNQHGMPDSESIVEGVEFDRHGAPVAYHVCTGYPGEHVGGQVLDWQRLEAFGAETGRRRVLQIWCDKDRPGQKRGAPSLAPVLEPLQKLERYASAELMAAIISAMFTVFLKKGADFDGGTLGLAALNDDQDNAVDQAPVQLGEGAVVDLAPGEEPMIANPARPNAQFDPFFTAVVKEIGAALELPMEELMLYYSSSYSAARAAMLQAWRAFHMRRWWLVYHLGEPEIAFMFAPPPPGEWVALDCETTGLNPRTDEIVSIGAVRIVGERILTSERLELLVRPEKGVSADSVRSGQWRFNPALAPALGIDAAAAQRQLLHYAETLERSGKYALTVWPYHAMLGGIGHALVSAVEEAVFFHGVARASRPDFHIKGDNPFTEHYSVIGPEVLEGPGGGALARKSEKFVDMLARFDAVVIAGQAKSHCVAWTIADLLRQAQARDARLARKVYLLEDCTSPVVVPGAIDYTDEADAAFRRFAEAGMHVVRSTQPLAEWPGMPPR